MSIKFWYKTYLSTFDAFYILTNQLNRKFFTRSFSEILINQNNKNLQTIEVYDAWNNIRYVCHRGGCLSVYVLNLYKFIIVHPCTIYLSHRLKSHSLKLSMKIINWWLDQLIYRPPTAIYFVDKLSELQINISRNGCDEVILCRDLNLDILRNDN